MSLSSVSSENLQFTMTTKQCCSQLFLLDAGRLLRATERHSSSRFSGQWGVCSQPGLFVDSLCPFQLLLRCLCCCRQLLIAGLGLYFVILLLILWPCRAYYLSNLDILIYFFLCCLFSLPLKHLFVGPFQVFCSLHCIFFSFVSYFVFCLFLACYNVFVTSLS